MYAESGGDISYTLYVLLGYFVLATIFYWGYMVKHQKFSEEEKKLMFKAYLINANRQKMRRLLRNNKVAPNAQTSTNKNSNRNTSSQPTTARSSDDGKVANTTAAVCAVPEDLVASVRNDVKELQSRSTESSSVVIRPAESLSVKVMHFLSSKMNAVVPEELAEYQQLAVLSAGGIIEVSEEVALQERFGMNDIEAAVENSEEVILSEE